MFEWAIGKNSSLNGLNENKLCLNGLKEKFHALMG